MLLLLTTEKTFSAVIIVIVLQSLTIVGMILGFALSRKKTSNKSESDTPVASQSPNLYGQYVQQQYPSSGGQVAYCKKCANQYDASLWICPYCGTPR